MLGQFHFDIATLDLSQYLVQRELNHLWRKSRNGFLERGLHTKQCGKAILGHRELVLGLDQTGLGPCELGVGLEDVNARGVTAVVQYCLDTGLRFDIGFRFPGKIEYGTGTLEIQQDQKTVEDQRLPDIVGGELGSVGPA